jgi:hypothetical protein
MQKITRSVRLRSSAPAYFNRSTGNSLGNRYTWTWSAWVKRGAISQRSVLFSAALSQTQFTFIEFTAFDQLRFAGTDNNTTNGGDVITSSVYRDMSAWYHIVYVHNETQAISSNRNKFYVNGVQVTSFATASYTPLNWGNYINANCGHGLGINYKDVPAVTNTNNFDGYFAEINQIDGQALTPSSFGQTNQITGVWESKKYSGTYGTNGFYLKFADNSAATATTIGKDSIQANNWTPNNISVTAGVTYDSMLDVPTNNYCTLNPIDKTTTATLGSGNLQTSSAASQNIVGSISMDSGSWYWEILYSAATASQLVGVYKTSAITSSITPTTNVIGIRFNANSGTLDYTVDGSTYTSISTGLTGGGYFPYAGSLTNAKVIYANFGQRPFSYSIPFGYFPLCTSNFTAPTVVNGASVMAATPYTGTQAALTITNTNNGVSFQPDFVWIKGRSGATDHALYDAVRGTTKDLVSNSTAAETTQATGLTAFNADGFGIGTLAKLNSGTATYIAWQWKAGGTAVSNTDGTITSQVSANTTAGFSVVTATKSAEANCTIGHGLGVAPKMVIFKTRDFAADSWGVWHAALAGTEWLVLNTTAAKSTNANIWNSTAPTSSVISVGTSWSGTLALAYCFAEIAGYSKFGSYTGNGSADGPFVYCGFKPRFIMVKASSTTGEWAMIDTSRSTFNVAGITSSANTAAAEAALLSIDILSNGFKIRSATLNNTSAATYIFAAFAENSIKYALAN